MKWKKENSECFSFPFCCWAELSCRCSFIVVQFTWSCSFTSTTLSSVYVVDAGSTAQLNSQFPLAWRYRRENCICKVDIIHCVACIMIVWRERGKLWSFSIAHRNFVKSNGITQKFLSQYNEFRFDENFPSFSNFSVILLSLALSLSSRAFRLLNFRYFPSFCSSSKAFPLTS